MDIENQQNKPESTKKEKQVHKAWLGGYIILGVASILLYLLSRYGAFDFLDEYRRQVKRLSLTAFFIFASLMVSRYAQLYSDRHTISMNTWIEASVNYLVDPKNASATRSNILKLAVKRLLEQPDKVMFPKSNAR